MPLTVGGTVNVSLTVLGVGDATRLFEPAVAAPIFEVTATPDTNPGTPLYTATVHITGTTDEGDSYALLDPPSTANLSGATLTFTSATKLDLEATFANLRFTCSSVALTRTFVMTLDMGNAPALRWVVNGGSAATTVTETMTVLEAPVGTVTLTNAADVSTAAGTACVPFPCAGLAIDKPASTPVTQHSFACTVKVSDDTLQTDDAIAMAASDAATLTKTAVCTYTLAFTAATSDDVAAALNALAFTGTVPGQRTLQISIAEGEIVALHNPTTDATVTLVSRSVTVEGDAAVPADDSSGGTTTKPPATTAAAKPKPTTFWTTNMILIVAGSALAGVVVLGAVTWLIRARLLQRK